MNVDPDLINIINKIAEAIGQGVEYIWPLMVKKVISACLIWIISLGILFSSVLILSIIMLGIGIRTKQDEGVIMGATMIVGCIVVACCIFPFFIIPLLNPEVAALEEIIYEIKY